MIRRPLFLRLFALLLLLAGPVSASHPPMMTDTPAPEPCHEMGDAAHAMKQAHAETSEAPHHSMAEPDHDCDSQCVCCPGSCSGFVALTAQGVNPTSTPNHFLLPATDAVPARTPLELLRPPKTA